MIGYSTGAPASSGFILTWGPGLSQAECCQQSLLTDPQPQPPLPYLHALQDLAVDTGLGIFPLPNLLAMPSQSTWPKMPGGAPVPGLANLHVYLLVTGVG